LSILPFGALMLFGEELFGFVFGENWAKAGYYSQIMAPWLLMNFLSSPVSMVPTILKKQQIFFYFGIASALLLIFSVAINSFFPSINWGFEQILWLVSASQFALHAVMLVWLIYITKKHA
jgi:O-antigen/teichoic acid export membrane protein